MGLLVEEKATPALLSTVSSGPILAGEIVIRLLLAEEQRSPGNRDRKLQSPGPIGNRLLVGRGSMNVRKDLFRERTLPSGQTLFAILAEPRNLRAVLNSTISVGAVTHETDARLAHPLDYEVWNDVTLAKRHVITTTQLAGTGNGHRATPPMLLAIR